MPRYDVHFQAMTKEAQMSTFKIMEFGFSPPLAVKGFQMLINHWAKTFLTRKGSDPTNLERGTVFTNLIGSNTTLTQAEGIVRTAIDDCNEQIRGIQQTDATLTPVERLADARLIKYTADPAAPGFDAYVEIRNQAGERLQLLLPELARS